jgi:hypothetical protein
MPKRYRHVMTEFLNDEELESPKEGCPLRGDPPKAIEEG